MLPTRIARTVRGGVVVAAALLAAVLALPSTAAASPNHTERASNDVVRYGTGYQSRHGSQRVRVIQRRLRRLGFAPGPIDGRFGPVTQRAVVRFQATRRLTPDGVVGRQTYTRLRSARLVLHRGAGYTLPHGSRTVRTIQRRLRTLGYATGPVDGRFGPLTEHAVTAFQADHGLEADGAIGPRTLGRLTHPTPSGKSTPKVTAPPPAAPTGAAPKAAAPNPAAPRPGAAPAQLPAAVVRDILIALALLGLGVFLTSYARTRRRLARSGSLASREAARGRTVAGRLQERAR